MPKTKTNKTTFTLEEIVKLLNDEKRINEILIKSNKEMSYAEDIDKFERQAYLEKVNEYKVCNFQIELLIKMFETYE